MGQVLHTSGNYELRVAENGTIKLNTGPSVGLVDITGSLLVQGPTAYINSSDVRIKDNVVVLNHGETSDRVSLGQAGIQIDRGSSQPASLVYEETTRAWAIAHGESSGLDFNFSRLKVKEIITETKVDGGNLTLIGSGQGVVRVGDRGDVVPYEDLVQSDDDVPNKKYVDDAITKRAAIQILRDDTRVIVFDKDSPVDLKLFPFGPFVNNPSQSQIAFVVDNRRVGYFTLDSFELPGLSVFAEQEQILGTTGFPVPKTITLDSTNSNTGIKLVTRGQGKVQVTNGLQVDTPVQELEPVENATVVYSGSVGIGASGLYATNSEYRDELVLTNRALLFSMLF